MTKSFTQVARLNEISLAIERFFIGAYPQTFTPARVDCGSPPAGYFDMGNIVEDTPSIKIGRESYKLELGMPRTTQFEKVIAVSGTVEFSVHSHSFYQAQFALGNASTITTVTTLSSGDIKTQYMGTGILQEFALLGVADFLDGTQLIHEFPRVTPGTDWTEQVRPGENMRMPFSFNAKSVIATIGGCPHLIVGKRHWIAPDGTCI